MASLFNPAVVVVGVVVVIVVAATSQRMSLRVEKAHVVAEACLASSSKPSPPHLDRFGMLLSCIHETSPKRGTKARAEEEREKKHLSHAFGLERAFDSLVCWPAAVPSGASKMEKGKRKIFFLVRANPFGREQHLCRRLG